jgi:hypothetical protein
MNMDRPAADRVTSRRGATPPARGGRLERIDCLCPHYVSRMTCLDALSRRLTT